MTVFAKIFEQIFDSSIADDYVVRHVFMDLLVLADRDGVVDMTLQAISRRTNVPVEIVTHCVELLASPDNRSRSDLEGGARIVLLDSHRDWGWQIVNYDHYRQIRDEESRKAYFRDYKRSYRSKKTPESPTPSNSSPTVSTLVLDSPTMSTKAEVDVEVDTRQKPSRGKRESKHPLTKTAVKDARHTLFKSAIFSWWAYANGEGSEPPWNGAEGSQLSMLLEACPKMTEDSFKRMLHNRGKSGDAVLTARPSLWLSKITSYEKKPLNQFSRAPDANGFDAQKVKLEEFIAKGSDDETNSNAGNFWTTD